MYNVYITLNKSNIGIVQYGVIKYQMIILINN